jgi:phosphoglycolate phosphatase
MAVAVIFDLDGTLIDSAPDIRAVACTVLAARGLPPITLDQTRSFIGSGVPVFVDRMRAARGLPPDPEETAAMVAGFRDLYEDAHDLTRPYPGAFEALEVLAKAGHPLGLCTNKPYAPTLTVLDHFGIRNRFGAILGGDSLPVRKPDPAPLREVLARLGGGPAIYVGDSEVDADTAHAAGIPFLLFTEGYRKGPSDAMPQAGAFDDFRDLPALIARHRLAA